MPPAAPSAPRAVSFSDQVDGRHLLFATCDAYRDAARLRFSAHWVAERADGTDRSAGRETVSVQADAGRLAIVMEPEAPKRRVRRAIVNGGTLLATDYEEAAPKPTRQYLRLPLEAGVPYSRALAQVQFAPRTRASEFLLTPEWLPRNAAVIYRSYADDTPGTASVIEIDRPTGSDKNPTVVTHRYTIRPATHRLVRYEEWSTTTATDSPAAASAKRRRTRDFYQREDYDETPADTIPADTFSQTLPPGYVEQALPSVALPPLPRSRKRPTRRRWTCTAAGGWPWSAACR